MKYSISKTDDLRDRIQCLLNNRLRNWLWRRLEIRFGSRLDWLRNRVGFRLGRPLYNQLRNRLYIRLRGWTKRYEV
jgi:hypothetical protein